MSRSNLEDAKTLKGATTAHSTAKLKAINPEFISSNFSDFQFKNNLKNSSHL
jgi:hypothetical protein